jgi:hypothetical protein
MLTTKDNNTAISEREKTMSTWKLTALALVLGLVFCCSAANAAVLDLKIEIVNYDTGVAIDPTTLVAGMDFGIAISALSTGTGNNPGGVSSAAWWISTPDTINVAVPLAAGAGPNANKVMAKFSPSVDGQFNFSALASKTDIGGDGDVDASNQAFGISKFTSDGIGVGGYTLLATQKWHMNATEPATLLLVVDAASTYHDYTEPTTPDYTRPYTSVAGMSLLIGPGGNEAPTIKSVSKSQITESDWDINGQLVYNGDAHSMDVSAVGEDADGDAVSFRWKMNKPGGGSVTLAETGAALHMTIADIKSLGLPDWTGPGTANIWDLTVEAFDGTAYSAPTIIPTFVPEPATMGLLAFGVVGLLKRRRRA